MEKDGLEKLVALGKRMGVIKGNNLYDLVDFVSLAIIDSRQ